MVAPFTTALCTPIADPLSSAAYLLLRRVSSLLASASDLGAASWTDQPPDVVAAVASTGGSAIAPVVSVASATCAGFGFRALSGFAEARFCAVSLGVSAVGAGAVVSVLATTTRADDFSGLAGKSSLGVDGCA